MTKRFLTIDDVISVMEEFQVTTVSATVTFDTRHRKLSELASQYGLEYVANKPQDSNVAYLFPIRSYMEGTMKICGIEVPTVQSFKDIIRKFKEQKQYLPGEIRGFYPGGTDPKISDLRLPLLFSMHLNGPKYVADSDLKAIRANDYKHPFPVVPLSTI